MVAVVTAASPTAVKNHTVVRNPTAVATAVTRATAVKKDTAVKRDTAAAMAADTVVVVRAMDARREDTVVATVAATSPVSRVTMVNNSNSRSALTTVDGIWHWVLVRECWLVERQLLGER